MRDCRGKSISLLCFDFGLLVLLLANDSVNFLGGVTHEQHSCILAIIDLITDFNAVDAHVSLTRGPLW